ncbi:hypothetical protein HDU76_003540, partial [Blyttiomyces sp. JEL0837]
MPPPSTTSTSSLSTYSAFGENRDQAFRDVMIFEERLRQNMLRLNRSRRRWGGVLILSFLYFAYHCIPPATPEYDEDESSSDR